MRCHNNSADDFARRLGRARTSSAARARARSGMAAENIAKAVALKETGNEAFKRGDYKQAMISYHQVRALHA